PLSITYCDSRRDSFLMHSAPPVDPAPSSHEAESQFGFHTPPFSRALNRPRANPLSSVAPLSSDEPNRALLWASRCSAQFQTRKNCPAYRFVEYKAVSWLDYQTTSRRFQYRWCGLQRSSDWSSVSSPLPAPLSYLALPIPPLQSGHQIGGPYLCQIHRSKQVFCR